LLSEVFSLPEKGFFFEVLPLGTDKEIPAAGISLSVLLKKGEH
jgi:hypothetical protein